MGFWGLPVQRVLRYNYYLEDDFPAPSSRGIKQLMKQFGSAIKTGFLCLALSCLLCTPVHAQDAAGAGKGEVRLAKLSALFKMNVAAQAYLSYCDRTGKIPLAPYYVANLKAVEYMLMKELMKSRGEVTSSKAQESVERRHEELTQAAYVFYRKSGCNSDRAKAARAHIGKIGEPKTSELLEYLRDIENR